MVNVSGEGHHDRGGNALFEQTAELALGIDLSAESGHAEIVLGADGGNALLLKTASHQATSGGHQTKTHVNTGLNLLRQPPPVGGIECAGRSLKLSSGDPIVGLVATAVGRDALGALTERGTLPEGLHSEGELGGDRLEEATNVDTGNTALKGGRVDHLERGAEVVAGVLVLELGHVLVVRSDLDLRLGN